MPRGRPKKQPYVSKAIAAATPASRAPRVYKTPMDIVAQMQEYQAIANGKNRGLFEDCKADIYRLWLLDYNDWRLKEVKGTGTSDRVFHEWRAKFVRAFGMLHPSGNHYLFIGGAGVDDHDGNGPREIVFGPPGIRFRST